MKESQFKTILYDEDLQKEVCIEDDTVKVTTFTFDTNTGKPETTLYEWPLIKAIETRETLVDQINRFSRQLEILDEILNP